MRPLKKNALDTRKEILSAAEKCFGATGYAGTSIQDIIAETSFSKPVIYYHFGNKEGLFLALLEEAYNECYSVMEQAIKGKASIRTQLISINMGLFDFLKRRRELTRLSFIASFSSKEELPGSEQIQGLRLKIFDLLHNLMKEGCQSGELDASMDPRHLAYGIYGAFSFSLTGYLTLPGIKLNQQYAESVVDFFLKGAESKKRN
jgi:AcrR family transcriptional regulator